MNDEDSNSRLANVLSLNSNGGCDDNDDDDDDDDDNDDAYLCATQRDLASQALIDKDVQNIAR